MYEILKSVDDSQSYVHSKMIENVDYLRLHNSFLLSNDGDRIVISAQGYMAMADYEFALLAEQRERRMERMTRWGLVTAFISLLISAISMMIVFFR